MMDASALSRYLCNPDVVLREEDDDGGLLFNPDTNRIRVLNHTGLFIWKLCDGSRNLENIATALREAYDEIPEEQVDHQVKEFVDEMIANGFIGIQESDGVKN
jgi:hypothetical protein